MSQDLSEKISKLEFETNKLEDKIVESTSYTSYFFLAAVILPFMIFFILYNLRSFRDEDEVDRKKVLKYTIPITFVIWGGLYGVNWYLKNKE